MTPDPLAWQPHPDVWLLAVALAGGYLYALSAYGPRLAPGRPAATRRQRTCFLAGVAVLWIGADWPIHGLAEDYLFFVHMGQHMLFQFIAPPLLILGLPTWLLRAALRPPAVFAVAKRLTRALPALVIVNVLIVASHWPAWVNATVHNGLLHVLAHALIVGTALLMWWPVLSPLPELPHLSYPGRMVYLFGHSVIPTVPASFLTFSTRPLYSAYVEAPRLADWLTPAQDQQIAGLMMKLVGGLLLWAVIGTLFFRWQHEEESGGPDILYWHDLEPDLAQRELSRS